MKNYIIIILIITFPFFLFSQTFDEYKKKQEQEIKKMQQDYKNYVKEKDKEFEIFLKQEWESFRAFGGKEVFSKPKPEKIPEYKPVDKKPAKQLPAHIPAIKKPLEIQIPDTSFIPLITKVVEKPITPLPEESINFYGKIIKLPLENYSCPEAPVNINRITITRWWKEAQNSNYESLISALVKCKKNLHLNDWAYYKLLEKVSSELCNEQNNGRLMHWFLLNRSAYDARIAFADNKVSVLLPVKQQLYATDFITKNGKNYYLMNDLENKNIKTYKKGHSAATHVCDLNVYETPSIGSTKDIRYYAVIYNIKTYTFSLEFNKNLTDFYSDYPQTDLEVYFDAAVSDEFRNSVLQNLKPIVNKMNKENAINFLLRFVQYSIKYKTDDEQFSYEKFFFPEETLFYPFADCEDRSVLFAWLVRELTDIEVLGLQYPGHVATAVDIKNYKTGYFIAYNNKHYPIADPTYIGASLGVSMMKFVNSTPVIVLMKN